MGIENFVAAALDQLSGGRYDVAMSLACSAVDGTTAKMPSPSNRRNNERFKSFLEANMRIITRYGFPGIEAAGIRIKCRNIPKLQTDAEGYVSIADIIYHVVRCSVVHECSIDDRIEFTDTTMIGDVDTKFRIPHYVIFGLLAAVVQSPANADIGFAPHIRARLIDERTGTTKSLRRTR